MTDVDHAVDGLLFHSQYDYEAAEDMYYAQKWLYVMFLCQQAVEKAVKALYIKTRGILPPHTHNINTLVNNINVKEINDKLKSFNHLFSELTGYYIKGRYQLEINTLLKSLDREKCKEIYFNTGEALECIESLIQTKQ